MVKLIKNKTSVSEQYHYALNNDTNTKKASDISE